MKKQLFTAFVLVAFAAGMMGTASAEPDDGQRNSTVNVTVASQTAIDVHPQALKYESINPGNVAGSSSESNKFGKVELENVGSTDIEAVWVNSTQTTSQDPFFGSSDPSAFDSGNMLQVRPTRTTGPLQGDTSNYNFVNRREYGAFNNSLNPEYINAPDAGNYYVDNSGSTDAQASDVAVGRFRVGDQEYFWALPVGSNAACDGSGTNTFNSLFVAKKPHNASTTIPVDFTSDEDPDNDGDDGYAAINGRDYRIHNLTTTGAGDYGITGEGTGVTLDDPSDGESRKYDILAECDTDNDGTQEDTDAAHTIRTRYNVEAGGNSDIASNAGAATQYLMNGGSNQLDPGQSVKLDVRVMVPRGVPQGVISEGVLHVVVSTSNAS